MLHITDNYINYYQNLKEERISKLKIILNNSEEIINELIKLEKEHGFTKILPLYDEIIELALMGEKLDCEYVRRYYQLFSNASCYERDKLKYAIRAFKYSTEEDLYKLAPWYYKIWMKIKKIFKW